MGLTGDVGTGDGAEQLGGATSGFGLQSGAGSAWKGKKGFDVSDVTSQHARSSPQQTPEKL